MALQYSKFILEELNPFLGKEFKVSPPVRNRGIVAFP